MKTATSTVTYRNINNDTVTSTLVTQIGELLVAKARNPYGSHNLILIKEIDGELVAIRHGNVATLSWVASEENTDRKLKKAIRRTIEAVGYNPLANKPISRLQELVTANHSRYIARKEAERASRVCSVHSCDGSSLVDYSEEEY